MIKGSRRRRTLPRNSACLSPVVERLHPISTLVPVRLFSIFLLCLLICSCSGMDLPPPQEESPPDDTQLSAAIATSASEHHFAPPIEVSDVFRAPPSSTPPWMVCVRSGASDEARRLTYSVFFGKDSAGTPGRYIKSRYSAYVDNCGSQAYHPFVPVPAAPPPPPPSPPSEPKKRGKNPQ